MFTSTRRLTLAAGLVFAVLMAGSVEAQKGPKPAPKPTGPTPVTATFRCSQGFGCDPAGTIDRIQGDWSDSYTGSATAQQGAYLGTAGDFDFWLQPGLGRFVSLDFTQPTGTAPCVATRTCRKTFTTVVTDALQLGSITNPVDAADTELANGLLSIVVGQTAPARFKLNFGDPNGRGYLWTIRFNPTVYPGSGYVYVTRTSTTTWEIEATSTDVAELVAVTTSGKQGMTHEGFSAMPFRISVRK